MSRTSSPSSDVPLTPDDFPDAVASATSGGIASSLVPALPVVLWMTGALFAFCGLAVTMRGLAHSVDVFEANAIRTGGGLLGTLAFMLATGRRAPLVDRRNLGALVSRNAVHWGSSLLWTLSVTLLPLATVFSIEFTTPIWVAIVAAVFMGTRTPLMTLLAMVLGFVGVLAVVRPEASSLSGYVALPVLTAAGLGVSSILTKRLTRRNTVTGIVFWMMLLQFAANMSVVAFKGGVGAFAAKFLADGHFLADAAGLVACGLASQVCLTSALRLGNPVTVVSLDFLRIPLVSVIGYELYGETVGLHTFLGSAAIVVAVVAITLNGEREKVRQSFVTAPRLATA